jgi:hypothetical protein
VNSMKKVSAVIPLILFIFLADIFPVSTACAQDEIRFSELVISNDFPAGLTIQITATSPDQQIVGAEIAYSRASLYSPESYTVEEIEITPGSQVTLEYRLDTEDLTTPPMMSYLYHWELRLADGTDFISETYSVQYTDIRYDWQVLDNDLVAVWWHDKPAAFGQAVFDIAGEAVRQQSELFQADLNQQIQVVINNDSEEFASWHNLSYDWVGGETYTDYGITVQIVTSRDPEDGWLYGVIPHEISHIFFDQVTYNPTVSIPVWLNEGVAQFNEFTSQEWSSQQVKDAARSGNLIQLNKLANGFGAHDTNRVYLAYAESLSAVNYLVETYGTEGLLALLTGYRDGNRTDEAFEQALGISSSQFELDWAASLDAAGYQISTPPPMPTFPPSPTPGAGSFSGATPVPQQEPAELDRKLPICSSLFGLLGFSLITVWKKRNSSLL